MKTTRTQAIILRRTNYGEADRILQLLTPEGRQGVIARGVRKEKSKLAGGIELFAISDVVLGQGKGELQIVTSAKLIQFYNNILKDYDRLQFGYLAIKVVGRASDAVNEPEWFDLLSEVFMGLDVLTIPLPLVEAWFYLRYAGLLGHDLNLEIDISGEKLQQDETYRYDSAEQGLRTATNGELTGEHIKLLRLIASRPLKVLVQVGGVGQLLPAVLQVAREHAAVDAR